MNQNKLYKPDFFNRELSWLSFNYRVLQEAKDKNVPLLERLKFLAIYSSNLDEFFRVRVASLRSLLALKTKTQKKLRFDPQKLLDEIKHIVSKQQEEFGKIYREDILRELKKNNINIVDDKNFPKSSKKYLQSYFSDKVVPFIHTLLLDKDKHSTFLHNKALYFAVCLTDKNQSGIKNKNANTEFEYAIVEIPSEKLGRFITLPTNNDKNYVMFLDDVIKLFLPDIFPSHKIDSCYSIKLTRDAELYIDDEFTGNLLAKIKKGLSKRKTGVPSRFLYDNKMPESFLKFLRGTLNLKKDDLIEGGRYHNFNDFFSFPNFNLTKLEFEPLPPIVSKDFDKHNSVFDAISEKDVLLSFPYQSYGYVVKFLEEAANDPNVKTIKITLYRVASESLVIRSLLKAVENGKKVTAFVEVKARFDEESNFSSGEALQNGGVKVLYSFPGLKVHSKLCVVERVEKGKTNFYTYLGTGNFNEKTARIYCDHALFTKDKQIAKDANNVFKFLLNKDEEQSFDKLLVAPFNMRSTFVSLIDNEIKNSKGGKKAEIIIKLNSIEDRKMIKKLYEASQAGVKIRLIVRGICCLIPGKKGLSENISAISIVDRFLEHARIYVFHNGGEKLMYVASADWMRRNLSRRIEVAFPILDKKIKAQLLKLIELQWNDNTKARVIDESQKNEYRTSKSKKKIRSQYEIYDYIQEINSV
ncbi:MAG: polyphosphate kinase 1 [Bacteroidetes bacterium]|nr:polyphosphate kinase 1 [Bacteroidota bacterium]